MKLVLEHAEQPGMPLDTIRCGTPLLVRCFDFGGGRADFRQRCRHVFLVPQDVLDRIAPTALPRSSLVISDEPLNRETNYRTEWVVVLNNQPQGGLAMRPRSDDVRVAGRGGLDDFFGGFHWGNSDSQYANTRQRGGQNTYFQRQW